MSRKISEEYLALNLLGAQSTTTSVNTGSAVDVEQYYEDAMVIASQPDSFSMHSGVTVAVIGSLVATPSTYDQTLVTMTASGLATSYGAAAKTFSVNGIKNIKGVATLTGSTVCNVAIVALVRPVAKIGTLNTGVPA